jgi:thioredoxin
MSAIEMNNELFENKVLGGNEPVLVEFWAPWCVYCRRIAPALDKVAQQYAGKVMVAKVNIDDEPLLAAREQIEVIPTLIIYQNGQALGSIVAPESKARIDDFILENLGE